ncbi:MAG: glycine cleavage system aminomethyltransferase GcvT [Thermomicrobiales bacterium]|nr:glycine cleavage system aminomethyltransferase GcvT [Thermomicrobiales bacterium]
MTESENEVLYTPLYDRHVALGARLIPFAGWMMPVQYAGILHEHRLVRSKAGLFDLGHMGQVEVTGPDSLAFLQYVASNDVAKIEPGKAQYALLTNEHGGVVDDIIIYRPNEGEGYFVCVNASNKEKDVAWMQRWAAERGDLDVTVTDISDKTGMIAIQGPDSEQIMTPLVANPIADLDYFAWMPNAINGIPVRLARTGYTGEDGFEIYSDISDVGAIWDAVYAAGQDYGLEAIGLGARDTLRLEARMPLYGNEMDDVTTPLEAGLGWAVKLDKGDFIGRDKLVAQKEAGVPRKTIGFVIEGRSASPRSHFPLRVDGREVGFVTSGAFSPTLETNLGLGLVEADIAGIGKPIDVIIRDRAVPAVQVKTPFYKRGQS